MRVFPTTFALLFSALVFPGAPGLLSAAPPEPDRVQEAIRVQDVVQALKLSFATDSSSVLFLEQGGRKYRIDVATRSVTEVSGPETAMPLVNAAFAKPAQAAAAQAGGASVAQPASPAASQAAGQAVFQANCARCHGADGKGMRSVGTPDFVSAGMDQAHVADTVRSGKARKMPSFAGRLSDTEIAAVSQFVSSLGASGASGAPQSDTNAGVYKPGDDVVFSLPTGRTPDRGALYVNFSHRFPYDAAFSGKDRGDVLFGLDESALSSLGLRYGITDKLSVDLFRSPTFIGRPIQLQTAYSLLSEQNSAPFNLTARVSVEGQNEFRKN